MDFGTVMASSGTSTRHLLLGYDDIASLRFFGVEQWPYWRHGGKRTIFDVMLDSWGKLAGRHARPCHSGVRGGHSGCFSCTKYHSMRFHSRPTTQLQLTLHANGVRLDAQTSSPSATSSTRISRKFSLPLGLPRALCARLSGPGLAFGAGRRQRRGLMGPHTTLSPFLRSKRIGLRGGGLACLPSGHGELQAHHRHADGHRALLHEGDLQRRRH